MLGIPFLREDFEVEDRVRGACGSLKGKRGGGREKDLERES